LTGDSGRVLAEVLSRPEMRGRRALFWLDGHYSEGVTAKGALNTPILNELSCLADSGRRGDAIFIDDVHCFGTMSDYPSLDELTGKVGRLFPGCRIAVKDNIVRIII